ncbi:hypothetical protein D3C77_519570 [compost metagenome]
MFDMTGEAVFLEYCLRIESNYCILAKVGELKFTKMSSDKTTTVDDWLIHERCYEVKAVLELLQKVGFKDLEQRTLPSGRVIFTAIKLS